MKSFIKICLLAIAILPTISFAQRTLNTTLPVGFTEGSYAVGPTGAASYQIPIYTPPGTASMVPSISLTYSSQSGMGPLGIGWSIAGLSSIERSGKNYFNDGENTEISFSNNDYFMLDGNRLVLISGTYGADNAVYAGESENFDKIISHGTAGNGPSWFEVNTKDGLILQYGNTTDSRIEGIVTGNFDPQGTARSWKLNRITDQSGNYITFEYTEVGGAAWINKISYTGNGTMTPYNSIEFSYISADNNPNKKMIYQGGSEIRVDKLLDYIIIKCEGTQMKKYDMVYSGTEDIRLTEVVEYGTDNTHYNSTYIEWSTPATGITSAAVDLSTAVFSTTADINNDGFSDVVYTTSNYDWYALLGSENGLSTTAYSGTFGGYIQEISSGDTDNDGKDEIYVFTTSTASGYSEMQLSKWDFTGNTFIETVMESLTTLIPLNIQIVDYTGDGINDWIVYNSQGYVVSSYPADPSAFPSDIIFGDRDFFFDFNGNGQADIIKSEPYYSRISIYEYNNQNSSFYTILLHLATKRQYQATSMVMGEAICCCKIPIGNGYITVQEKSSDFITMAPNYGEA